MASFSVAYEYHKNCVMQSFSSLVFLTRYYLNRGSIGYCGKLIRNEGAFQPCYSVVNTKLFFDKCVFDVCATDGDRSILEQVNTCLQVFDR